MIAWGIKIFWSYQQGRDATPPVIAGLIVGIPSARTALPTFGTAVVLFPRYDQMTSH